MADNNPMNATTGRPPNEVKATALALYAEAMADNDTAPAAFGFACAYIRAELDCTLHLSAGLMWEWLRSAGYKLDCDATHCPPRR